LYKYSFWKENNRLCIESPRCIGQNIISFQVISGKKKWKFIGVYILPSEEDRQTIQQLEMELNKQKNDTIIVAGDLNKDYVRLERSTQNIKISTTTASLDYQKSHNTSTNNDINIHSDRHGQKMEDNTL
jgi:hypothetical protein